MTTQNREQAGNWRDVVGRLRGPKNRPTVQIPLGNGTMTDVPGLSHWNNDDALRSEAAALIERQVAEIARLRGCLTMGAQINTPDFLEWVADRLVHVHGDFPHVDFVLSCRDRAKAMRAALAATEGADGGR